MSAVFPTSDFSALRPGRLLDTRPAPTVDSKFAGTGAVAADSTTRLVVAGRAGVPAGVASVALNLTSAEASSGYLTAYECGAPLPTASNLNYSPEVTVANMATVKVSAGGEVCLYSSASTHLIVDVTGYFTANGMHTVVPGRLADTRPGTPTIDGLNSGTGQRPTGGTMSLKVGGRASVPSTASAVMVNITSANARADGGYVTAFAAGGVQPGTSNLNYSTGRVVANSAIVQVGVGGNICLFTYGATDLIVDVVGWFDGPVPPATGAACAPDPVVQAPAPSVPPPPTNPIPAAQLPRGISGSDQVLIRSSAQQGTSTDVSGNFRFICGMSHMAYDDPIIFPGQPGRSHLHVFFGNTGVNASSNYESLLNSGNGTCSGGIANRSSYWMPALMNAGVPVVPKHLQVYYKSGYRGIAPSQIENVPNGLRIVAGTSSATTDQSSEIVEWYCTNGGGVDQHMINCGAGGEMQMGIIFPQCWDGVNLDSADHKSHMAYPGSGSNYGAGCPASHPVAIPVITMTQFFQQPAGAFSNLRLSSDPAGVPAGVSSHADYFEAWDPTIRDGWTQHCVREHRDCTRGLGDARQLYDPPGL